MFLASFSLSIYRNNLTERTREISILSNMKMFFNYDVSDHREDAVISRSRRIFNVLTIIQLWGYRIAYRENFRLPLGCINWLCTILTD